MTTDTLNQHLEYDTQNVWHVYPVNDSWEHETNAPDCHCNPRLELQDNGGLVVIHNSYDGRELEEYGNDKQRTN